MACEYHDDEPGIACAECLMARDADDFFAGVAADAEMDRVRVCLASVEEKQAELLEAMTDLRDAIEIASEAVGRNVG